MTAYVKIFAISGTVVAPVVGGDRLSYDSVQLIKWPPLGRDLLSCDASTVDTSQESAAPANTRAAFVQVEPGKRVYYEIARKGATLATPDATSPELSGETMLLFGPQDRISVKEIA